MKIFDGMQSFFNSLGEYVKNFSNLFLIFLGAFLLVSVIIVVITSFAYECKLTKTIDKINKFLERNPRINDDNLVAFNNLMKASSVPKTLRRQWQQFMLYREHSASYYMSFKHCVENPLRNSTYRQQMTVYKIITFVLVALSLVVSTFMAVQSFNSNLVLQDIVIIPLTILILYWLISMVLELIHSAISGDLFQNYQYFEINMDKAMLTLPEFVDYEVLFSQDEIRRGIPVLFAYLQKRAIQEQQELEKARLKSVDHEKFDFDKAGLDGSLVLDRAMRETENYTTQRKKYMQEIERVNNEISVLENNYREQTKEFQRQVQTSKETVENLKEQLEQASSTIEINYIKKQMRDEINRQQLSEKEFDILTDKHNQEIKTLNQEIKHYEEETKKAKDAMEVAMLSEFNTYSIKVYDNLEKIVDEKMQDRVDDYKDQIKGLEVELEEKNEELENVYTRYQEVLSQLPSEDEQFEENYVDEQPVKKGKKKKKSQKDDANDDGMVQPEQIDLYDQPVQEFADYDQMYNDQDDYEKYDNAQEYSYDTQEYDQIAEQSYNDQDYVLDNVEYDYSQDYNMDQNIDDPQAEYVPLSDDYNSNEEYVPLQEEFDQASEQYVPLDGDVQTNNEYVPLDESYNNEDAQYIPLQDENNQLNEEYVPLDNYSQINEEYVPLDNYSQEGFENSEYVPLDSQEQYVPMYESEVADNQPTEVSVQDDLLNLTDENIEKFDDSDFDIDFNKPINNTESFEDMDFDFDLGIDTKDKKKEKKSKNIIPEEDEGELDLNKILGLYEDVTTTKDSFDKELEVDNKDVEEDSLKKDENELPAPVSKRKPGRPRKVKDEDETDNVPKRKPGRPRKIVDENDETPKRKPGRPRKVKDEDESDNAPKRKPGRPRKAETQEENDKAPKRKPGRPRKAETQDKTEPKRKAGRPKKSTSSNKNTAGQPKRRGRPRKNQNSSLKQEVLNDKGVLGKPKRKAGRPRKSEN